MTLYDATSKVITRCQLSELINTSIIIYIYILAYNSVQKFYYCNHIYTLPLDT
jgi:hypothetical protein